MCVAALASRVAPHGRGRRLDTCPSIHARRIDHRPEFAIPEHWPRAYGLDIRWNTAAVVWGARDPQSDVLYLYSEYLAEADPAIHAAAIRSRADWIPGLIDPAANGRD